MSFGSIASYNYYLVSTPSRYGISITLELNMFRQVELVERELLPVGMLVLLLCLFRDQRRYASLRSAGRRRVLRYVRRGPRY